MSILAILDLNDIQENSKDKYLNELTLDDLFLEVNYKNNTRSIILCKDQQFKILKKWGKPPKEDKIYDVAYLNKTIASL
jgi:hypothetical protein